MASSTSRPERGVPGLPQAWKIDAIDAATVADLHGLSPAAARSRRAALVALHEDAARVVALIERLPPPTLAILSLLIEAGGLSMEKDLVREAKLRFDIEAEFGGAVVAALEHLLVVPVQIERREPGLVLIAPAATHLRDALRDLDVAAVPVGDGGAEDVPGRQLLAVCAALTQVEVKVNQNGTLNLTGVKRLAKQVALDPGLIEGLILVGVSLGVVEGDAAGVLRPRTARLLALAEGRPRGGPMGGRLGAAMLAELREAPIPLALLQRWAERCVKADLRLRLQAPMFTSEWMRHVPGVTVRTGAGGEVAASVPLPDATAASVTPSFQVFVPPEARLTDLVRLVGCCELGRIDRMIVGQVTKASIARSVAAGETAATLLLGMRVACRTPVPQNVEAAIIDWAAGASHAVVETGQVIVVPPADTERARAALARFGPRTLAPGVLLVHEAEARRSVVAALVQAGIYPRASGVEDAAEEDGAVSGAGVQGARAELLPLRPSSVAVTRVAAWRALPRRSEGGPGAKATPSLLDPPRGADGYALLAAWQRRNGDRRDGLTEHEQQLFGGMLDEVTLALRRELLSLTRASQLRTAFATLSSAGAFDEFYAAEGVPVQARALLEAMLGANQPPVEIPTAASALAWARDDLRARLEAAASTPVLVDLGGVTRSIVVDQVLPRGDAIMVLGVDTEDASQVAIPLEKVLGVAAVPGAATRPWRPAPGEPPPAGHAPCPCGSGERYRKCCRVIEA